jgi:hypothetical protein
MISNEERREKGCERQQKQDARGGSEGGGECGGRSTKLFTAKQEERMRKKNRYFTLCKSKCSVEVHSS